MQIRQNGKYSSTNLIRGSMTHEMFIIFSESHINNDKKYLMTRVMTDNIVHKNSFYSRENVWRIFDQRYLSCPSWVVEDIASATSHGEISRISYPLHIFILPSVSEWHMILLPR